MKISKYGKTFTVLFIFFLTGRGGQRFSPSKHLLPREAVCAMSWVFDVDVYLSQSVNQTICSGALAREARLRSTMGK